jgi:hypothetical protein
MKSTRHLFALVCAVTLVLGGCDLLGNDGHEDTPAFSDAAYGRVAVRLGSAGRAVTGTEAGAVVRSIMPNAPDVFANNFSIDLAFTRSGASTVVTDVNVSGSGYSQELVEGQWTVQARCYTTVGQAGKVLAALGEAPVTISGNTTTPVNITVKPLTQGGPGIFAYTVTWPAAPALSARSITLTPLSGGPVISDNGFTSGTAGSMNVPAGTYETVYIYPGLTSADTFTFDPAHFEAEKILAGTAAITSAVLIDAGPTAVTVKATANNGATYTTTTSNGGDWTILIPVSVGSVTFKLGVAETSNPNRFYEGPAYGSALAVPNNGVPGIDLRMAIHRITPQTVGNGDLEVTADAKVTQGALYGETVLVAATPLAGS